MNTITQLPSVQDHPSSADAYIRNGWSLTAIPPGTKGPTTAGWNRVENALQSSAYLPPGHGVGLLHAYSGTMAFDIDEWNTAKTELVTHGIDLDQLYHLPDAVIIDSGKPGHGKLLYRMPEGMVLPTKKINIDGRTIFEMRCGTANGMTVQDVLPPSIHPETNQPYRWAGHGHWSRLPVVPDLLLQLWQSLITQDTQRTITSGESYNTSWDEIRDAISFIDPDIDRDNWVSVGMALHWAGNQTGQSDIAFHLWDEWSQGTPENPSTKYQGQQDLIISWRSFKPEGRTIASMFGIAKQEGWRRKQPTADELFGHIKVDSNSYDVADTLTLLRPPAPSPDLSLWPQVLRQRAEELGVSAGLDPLVPLFAGLAVASGAADSRIRLQLMPGFQVPPILWIMLIGESGDKKSPGSKPMSKILREIERDDRDRYKADLLAWEVKEAQHQGARKDYIEMSTDPGSLMGNEAMPVVPDLPPAPVPKKITVQDITSQKLIRHASERPEGLLCWLDEMHSWVNKVVDPRSGEDRSAWVSAYESEHYEMDRVGAGSILCENLGVSIYGNIQPRVLRRAIKVMGDDGLMQRFIPVVMRSDLSRKNEPIPDIFTNVGVWNQMVRDIHGIPKRTYTLSPEAYSIFRDHQDWYEKTKKEDRVIQTDDVYMTAFGKIEGLTGRLALVFHMMETPHAQDISGELMTRVTEIVRSYIVPSLRFMYTEMGSTAESLDHWVMKHILAYSGVEDTLNIRDIKKSARRQLGDVSDYQKTTMIKDAMYPLEKMSWVILTEDQRDHTTWTINPHLKELFKQHRREVLKIRQDRLDENMQISRGAGRAVERRYVPGYIEEFGE